MLLYVVEPRSSVVSHPTVMKTDKFGVSTAKSLPQVRFKIHKTMQCPVRDRLWSDNEYLSHNTKVKAFSSECPVELSGKFGAVVKSERRMTVAVFYVKKQQENGSLLCCNTSQELGVIYFPAYNRIVLARGKVKLVSRTKHRIANYFGH